MDPIEKALAIMQTVHSIQGRGAHFTIYNGTDKVSIPRARFKQLLTSIKQNEISFIRTAGSNDLLPNT